MSERLCVILDDDALQIYEKGFGAVGAIGSNGGVEVQG